MSIYEKRCMHQELDLFSEKERHKHKAKWCIPSIHTTSTWRSW